MPEVAKTAATKVAPSATPGSRFALAPMVSTLTAEAVARLAPLVATPAPVPPSAQPALLPSLYQEVSAFAVPVRCPALMDLPALTAEPTNTSTVSSAPIAEPTVLLAAMLPTPVMLVMLPS